MTDAPDAAASAGPLETKPVVTAFLRRPDGRILLVRRSARVGSYQGRWSAISGHLEDPTALQQARREILEETGIGAEALTLRAEAPPLAIDAPEYGTRWLVHPVLFDLAAGAIPRLDWENLEMDWVEPSHIAARATVPMLAEAYAACAADERARRDKEDDA
ncbi:MAG: NUDIX domain-containing protein [Alphaproteobacteria bacterium]|nr:NUDIX domain-containing protein [Alphaproteobacteria bacterium]